MGTEEEPRWLDDEEWPAWVALASMLVRLNSALDAQLQRDAGMSHFEYGVLAALSEVPERTLRMSSLAMLSDGSLPRLSQVVGRLEKRGWVRRTPDPTDGRYTLAILTDDGWAKLVDTAPGHVGAVRQYVFDSLTRAQVRQLTNIGNRVAQAIDPGAPCPTELRSRSADSQPLR
ncbi:DNA-binding MarR family transcriptional regulator [Kribbella sp. VKM Ac-2527]|uniref:DNA-binding MarR family transcriptional regulator n=1 Tax=Kribbella caucasensis TaxID=2512215 RepID=A0A4V3C9Y0_9ACTN|nr:MarR family transcriptional regulator [Kribbella sp. VKM Ac-2527]TDO47797.1 DNA-binding MarR family transcriptional regulator [Kribbella sp. VKM Ac-2527]